MGLLDFDDTVFERNYTKKVSRVRTRSLNTNPRAKGTNPRSKKIKYDKELANEYNEKVAFLKSI